MHIQISLSLIQLKIWTESYHPSCTSTLRVKSAMSASSLWIMQFSLDLTPGESFSWPRKRLPPKKRGLKNWGRRTRTPSRSAETNSHHQLACLWRCTAEPSPRIPLTFSKTVQIFLNHYDDKLTQKFSCTSNCLNCSLASTSAILQLWLGLWRHGHRPAGWVRRHSLHRKTAVNTQLTITVQDTIFIFMINHFTFYSPPHHITAAGQLHSAPTTLPDDGTSRSAKYFHKYKYLWSREREVSVHVHTGVIAIVHGRGFT